MKDTMNFKGYFKIESFDENKSLIDTYEDKNMIMTSASLTMAEIFSKLPSTFINKISFGTMGHVAPNVLQEKVAIDGFVNTRDRMFSEVRSTLAIPTVMNSVLSVLNISDVLYMSTTIPGNAGFYRFLSASTTNYTVTDGAVINTAIWEPLGTTQPYTYNFVFDLPGTNVNQTVGDSVLNLVEDDVASGSTITALHTGTSLTFIVDVVTAAANSQNVTYSAFTEAAMYANGRIFSMKTFKSKLKDNTVSLRVTWKITF